MSAQFPDSDPHFLDLEDEQLNPTDDHWRYKRFESHLCADYSRRLSRLEARIDLLYRMKAESEAIAPLEQSFRGSPTQKAAFGVQSPRSSVGSTEYRGLRLRELGVLGFALAIAIGGFIWLITQIDGSRRERWTADMKTEERSDRISSRADISTQDSDPLPAAASHSRRSATPLAPTRPHESVSRPAPPRWIPGRGDVPSPSDESTPTPPLHR